MIGSNFSISVDSHIPCRVHTQTNLAQRNGLVRIANTSRRGCLTNSLWISNLKPEYVEVNQLESFVQKVQGFSAIDYVYVSKQELQSRKRHLKNQMSFMMNLYMHVVQCFSMKCKKRHHKCCVSRTKLYTSGDIELNPRPVVTQGNNPNNRIELLQSC